MSTEETTDTEDNITLKLNVVSHTADSHQVKLLRLGVDGGIIIEPLGHEAGEDGSVVLEARMYLSDCPPDVAATLLRMAADGLDEALATGQIEVGNE